MSEDQSEEKVLFMSSLAEASHLVRAIGGGAGSLKEQRIKAWRKLSARFSWNRIVDLHRGEPRARVSADELRLLRAARAEQEAEREGRNEFRAIVERIARIEARLLSIDPDFHSASVAAFRESVAGLGGEDRPVD